jgi:hypothetical protein
MRKTTGAGRVSLARAEYHAAGRLCRLFDTGGLWLSIGGNVFLLNVKAVDVTAVDADRSRLRRGDYCTKWRILSIIWPNSKWQQGHEPYGTARFEPMRRLVEALATWTGKTSGVEKLVGDLVPALDADSVSLIDRKLMPGRF